MIPFNVRRTTERTVSEYRLNKDDFDPLERLLRRICEEAADLLGNGNNYVLIEITERKSFDSGLILRVLLHELERDQ